MDDLTLSKAKSLWQAYESAKQRNQVVQSLVGQEQATLAMLVERTRDAPPPSASSRMEREMENVTLENQAHTHAAGEGCWRCG